MIRRLWLRLRGLEEIEVEIEPEPETTGGWPPRLFIPPDVYVTPGSTHAQYDDWFGVGDGECPSEDP
ncbi:MAG: hypothetical protein DWQ20_00800 [Actinobacteria bacterium]|nr:MAG: hypothetical protein DWQ20_00800 [Actinomycetota bacterium]